MLWNRWRGFLLACVSSFCTCFWSCSTLKVYCIHTGLWHVKLPHFCPGALKQVGLYKGHFSQPPNSNPFFFFTNKQIVQLKSSKSSIFQKNPALRSMSQPTLKGKNTLLLFWQRCRPTSWAFNRSQLHSAEGEREKATRKQTHKRSGRTCSNGNQTILHHRYCLADGESSGCYLIHLMLCLCFKLRW